MALKGASVSVICEETLKECRENGHRREKTVSSERKLRVLWLAVAKNTSEEFKASGNSRLKTPLSSRELNSKCPP